jgi:hypothetical protein
MKWVQGAGGRKAFVRFCHVVDQRSNSDEERSNHILIQCVRDRQVSEKNV